MIVNSVLAFLAVAFAQPDVGTVEFTQVYDKFEEQTALWMEVAQLKSEIRHAIDMKVMQLFTGDTRRVKDGTPIITVHSYCRDGWVFLKHRDLIFLADGQPIPLAARYAGELEGVWCDERLVAVPTPEQISKILNAKKLSVRFGLLDYDLDDRHIAALAEFKKLCENPGRTAPVGNFVPPQPKPQPKTREQLEAERQAKELEMEVAEEAEAKERAEKLTAKLEQDLKLGKALEKSNPKAASDYYREVIDLAPGSPQAAEAKKRIDAME